MKSFLCSPYYGGYGCGWGCGGGYGYRRDYGYGGYNRGWCDPQGVSVQCAAWLLSYPGMLMKSISCPCSGLLI